MRGHDNDPRDPDDPVPTRAPVVRERPILFSGPMVRKILAGEKWMTRRALPAKVGLDENLVKYAPGMRLWVKETHRVAGWAGWDDSHLAAVEYRADMAKRWTPILTDDIDGWEDRQCKALVKQGAVEVASDEYDTVLRLPEGVEQHWKPSIFMPRWASRLTLHVEAVRVERLHEITDADAIAEGCSAGGAWATSGVSRPSARADFAGLWRSINGVESWHANPFVWVITFSVVR